MYFDFEDHRPETPRVTRPVSVREGVLISIIVHLVCVITLLLFPDILSPSPDEAAQLAALEANQNKTPLMFVEAIPLKDVPRPPERPAPQSDLDRRATAPEPAPVPRDPQPAMRGNTSEMVDGGPTTPPQPQPTPPSPPGDAQSIAAASSMGRQAPEQPTDQSGAQQRLRTPTDMFQNVGRYTRPDRFDNPQGSNSEPSADIQFDSMGVDFGSWLRRFKNQVERNWLIPPAVMAFKGRVVVRFVVLKNGTLIELQTLQASAEPSLTAAAVNALKLSNPTAALPPEYPADRMQITVTFYYNEDPRGAR